VTLVRITVDLSSIRVPTGSAEEMAFRTFRNYLEATCAWARELYPSPDGLNAGVAAEVKSRSWRKEPSGTKVLSPRAGQMLRNAWATEVLLNAPRTLGDDLVTFANLWTPVQAYYAVFNGITALSHIVTANPPHGHVRLLSWAATAAASPNAPFVMPWTARVGGVPGAWAYHDLGSDPINEKISNLVVPGVANAPSLLAMGLRTTRGDQIEEHRPGWLKGLTTTAGKQRANLPRAELLRRAAAMRPTTLFDLLYRLRIRSNYQEGDAFLTGPLSASDAADFHDALCTIVGATMLTVEIFVAHHVGANTLEANAMKVPIPRTLRDATVLERVHLW
jgi:hypothetical protein